MKLKYVLPGLVLLLLVGAACYPVTRHEDIIINTSLQKVFVQLSTPSGWVNWHTGISDKNLTKDRSSEKEFILQSRQGGVSVIAIDALAWKITEDGDDYIIELIPHKFDNKTTVRLTHRTGLLMSLLLDQKGDWLKKTSLISLKSYLENPIKYYGVNFIKAGTQDLNILVYRNKIKHDELFSEIQKGVKALKQQAGLHDTSGMDQIYLQRVSDEAGISLFVGIPLKVKPAHMLPGLEYLNLRASKALIVVYTGKFNGLSKVYQGIAEYQQDHYIRSRKQAIEIYDKQNLPLNDTTRVNTKITFPIE